jgi:uncharacterized protein YjdB
MVKLSKDGRTVEAKRAGRNTATVTSSDGTTTTSCTVSLLDARAHMTGLYEAGWR